MRKIIEYCLVSADGIVLDDPFPFQDYLDEAYLRERLCLFEACGGTLWGRVSYERFARRWAGSAPVSPYIARLGAMPKYVFTRTLETVAWNDSTIVRGELVAEITKLKEQEGGDLLVLGHGLLAETLLKHRLIDIIDLTIHPVFVGHGKPFLREGQATKLKFVATRTFSKLVKISFEPQY
jgi:dihydrofolate reductase